MADRKAKGMCMFCDEPFTPGHHLKHKRTQFLVVEMDEEEPVDEEIEVIEENGTVSVNSLLGDRPQLSMNALSGASAYQIMRGFFMAVTAVQIYSRCDGAVIWFWEYSGCLPHSFALTQFLLHSFALPSSLHSPTPVSNVEPPKVVNATAMLTSG